MAVGLPRNELGETHLSTPVPDPTERTNSALLREIASLKEIVFTRLDGMDEAIKLFHENITRVPTDTDKQMQHLRELVFERFKTHEEKFTSIQTQFKERDVRGEQTARNSKVAVDAALQAAKEAVSEQNKSSALAISKSEAGTIKQIDQIGALIQSTVNGINTTIFDLKDRLTRIEGEGKGSTTQVAEHQASGNYAVGIIGLIVGAVVGLGGLIVALIK